LIAEEKYPTILVTHERTEAFALCDRIGILFDGKLRQVGAPEELLHNPVDQQTAEFLGFANSLTGTITNVESGMVEFTSDQIAWSAVLPSGHKTSELHIGDTVTALFRPATLRPAEDNTDAVNRCPITVQSIHETESHYDVVAENGSAQAWTLLWPLTITPPDAGARVTCAIDPVDILLFPNL
jgi:ABC-type Fe3+/spermidine/putrescine transport system ATPase subunit